MNKKVFISEEVWQRLEQYINQIVSTQNMKYYVDEETALKKWFNIVNALITKLGNPLVDITAITPYYDMGKSSGYHQFNFRDGKSTLWYFGFEEKDNTIIVHIMKNANSVSEEKKYIFSEIPTSKCFELEEFHSWMRRLDEVKGARPTYWCK